MSVREAQEKISSKEFIDWVAYFDIEPHPLDRIEHSLNWLLVDFFNVNRKKGARQLKYEDVTLVKQRKKKKRKKQKPKKKPKRKKVLKR